MLPEAGRTIYLEAFQRARKEIRIEICVLEDPQILQSLKQAIEHGVHVRAIVDRGKYLSLTSERMNLAAYLTGPGGKLHLSNPIFPRSFPKVILIDGEEMLIGSACLDTDTFEKYRDYVYATDSSGLIEDLSNLFENDWAYTVPVGGAAPPFNSTPIINDPSLIVGPVSATDRLVSLIQNAKRTLDITTELLGNLTLESELAAAVGRGVEVRLISPISVNGAAPQVQKLQGESLSLLKAAGLQVHVTGPTESPAWPYMHARSALADNELLYIGSISLSPDSATVNREAGILISDPRFVDLVKA
ncbi:MAG TPA: phospholipase D-like domain-containing protein, partial [Methylocella sp.]|nr:phospholipase D-like domain-containing protein [Methylocella sp.]